MSRPPILLALFVLAAGARFLHVAVVDLPPADPAAEERALADAERRGWGAPDGAALRDGPPTSAPAVLRARPHGPPGHAFVLAGMRAVVGVDRRALVLSHALLASALLVPLGLAGVRLFGPRAGLAGAAAWAVFPPAWRLETQALSGPLLALLGATLLWALVRLLEDDSSRLARAGVLLVPVMAALLDPSAVLLGPAVAGLLWALPERARRRRIAVAALLLPLLVAVLPLELGNALAEGRTFLPAHLGARLVEGVADGDRSLPSPPVSLGEATRRVAQEPGAFVSASVRRAAVLPALAPDALWPGDEPLQAIEAASLPRALGARLLERPLRTLATFTWGPVLLVLALVGAVLSRTEPVGVALVLFLPAYGLLVHVPVASAPYALLPWSPPLALLGGVTLAASGRALSARRRAA